MENEAVGRRGRPPGSRNRRSRLGEKAIDDLRRRGEISEVRLLVALQKIAEGGGPDRVPAAKLLLAYLIGTPRLEFKIKHTHELSVENVLRQIAAERAERARKTLEAKAVEAKALSDGR